MYVRDMRLRLIGGLANDLDQSQFFIRVDKRQNQKITLPQMAKDGKKLPWRCD